MKQEKFNEIVEEMLDSCKETLNAKAAEYSDTDRLEEFKVMATLAYESPICMLKGKMSNHVAKLYMMIKKLDEGWFLSKEQWDEVIKDIINYCLLLKALLIDQGDI